MELRRRTKRKKTINIVTLKKEGDEDWMSAQNEIIMKQMNFNEATRESIQKFGINIFNGRWNIANKKYEMGITGHNNMKIKKNMYWRKMPSDNYIGKRCRIF